jgi:hypothetical protein
MAVRHQPHTVHFKQKWQDEWVLQEHVYCDSFTHCAGPDVREAVLSFIYGPVQPTDDQRYFFRDPKSVNGYYVKITLGQFTEDDEETVIYWHGLIVETTDERAGRVTHNGQTGRSGRQIFLCRGLEFLLQRTTVNSSFVLDHEGNEIEIGRGIGFNLGAGRPTDHERQGNKSEQIGERDAHIFAFTIPVGGVTTTATETTWSVQDIITYLFHYHPPWDKDGSDRLNWQVADGGDGEILGKLYPTVHAHGKTVFEILNEIIDRRRLVGWTINVQGDDENPKLDIFTFNRNSVSLPGGATIPANSNQQTFHFDNDHLIKSAVMAEDDATRFDVVIVRGDPLGSCFTIGDSTAFSETMIVDWHGDLADSYNRGAVDGVGYATLPDIDKQAADAAFRADATFAKVYRAFLLNPEFDGFSDEHLVCPDPNKEDEGGNPATGDNDGSPFWYPGLRFKDYLPLRTDYDYTEVDEFETTSLTASNSQPNYLRPFAVGQIDGNYYRLDRIGHGEMTTERLKTNGIQWSVSLRMQDDCPGLLIDVSGAPQHVIADGLFSPPDLTNEEFEPQMRWQDILCTVFCEFDQHCEVKYPAEDLTTDADVVRELIINVPGMRLDYLVPDTVIGLDENFELLQTDGGYVRDDRALMGDIARSAFEWYSQPRKAMTIVQHNLICDHTIGELITTIGTDNATEEVNSVITKMVFDLKAGTVTLFTQFAEIDFS